MTKVFISRALFEVLVDEALRPVVSGSEWTFASAFAAMNVETANGRAVKISVWDDHGIQGSRTNVFELVMAREKNGRPSISACKGRWKAVMIVHVDSGEIWNAWLQGPDGSLYPIGEVTIGCEMFLMQNRHDESADGWAYPDELFSRQRGALTDLTWKRIASLTYAIVGTGRAGSHVAEAFSATGVRSIALIDPDSVDVSDIGGMASVVFDDVGQPKVKALKQRLERRFPWLEVHAVHEAVSASSPAEVAGASDFVIITVDNPVACFEAAALATLLGKPNLVLASSVQLRDHTRNTSVIGADIIFSLPGESCMICATPFPHAGLSSRDEFHRVRTSCFAGVTAWHRVWQQPAWDHQRSGSLPSMSNVVAGLGLRVVEQYYAGTVSTGFHSRLVFDHFGYPQIEHTRWNCVRRSLGDCFCSFAGKGIDHLGEMVHYFVKKRRAFSESLR